VGEPFRFVDVDFSKGPSTDVDLSFLFLFKDVLRQVGVFVQFLVESGLAFVEQFVLFVDLRNFGKFLNIKTQRLHYKYVIILPLAKVKLQFVASLTYNSRAIIYYCNMLIL
jgi:hypothetical protein